MNSVVHFEMPYDNPERVANFYHAAFGWETQALGERMGNYVLATTTETDPDRRPTHPGAINGGFFPKRSDRPAQYPSIVIGVDNLGEARERVTRAGGTVLGEPMEIPGVGMYVSFMDPEGNRVAMLEPSPRDGRREKPGDRAQRQNRPSPRGPRTTPTPDRAEQEWSPRHSSDQPVEGERDDSYGANGKSGEVRKPRAAGKSSRSGKATGSPARRKR